MGGLSAHERPYMGRLHLWEYSHITSRDVRPTYLHSASSTHSICLPEVPVVRREGGEERHIPDTERVAEMRKSYAFMSTRVPKSADG